MEQIGFYLRGFHFSNHDGGGLDVTVRATDSSHSPIIRKLHMSEAELYEMLSLLEIGDDAEADSDDKLSDVEIETLREYADQSDE